MPEAASGFFYCGHCNHVIGLSAEADTDQTHKCPRCKKWQVRWRFESKPRVKAEPAPVPAFSEVANQAFDSMRACLDGGNS